MTDKMLVTEMTTECQDYKLVADFFKLLSNTSLDFKHLSFKHSRPIPIPLIHNLSISYCKVEVVVNFYPISIGRSFGYS